MILLRIHANQWIHLYHVQSSRWQQSRKTKRFCRVNDHSTALRVREPWAPPIAHIHRKSYGRKAVAEPNRIVDGAAPAVDYRSASIRIIIITNHRHKSQANWPHLNKKKIVSMPINSLKFRWDVSSAKTRHQLARIATNTSIYIGILHRCGRVIKRI